MADQRTDGPSAIHVRLDLGYRTPPYALAVAFERLGDLARIGGDVNDGVRRQLNRLGFGGPKSTYEAPFGYVVDRRPRGSGSVAVEHATYRNPLDVWLSFAATSAATAGAFVTIGAFLRDFGAKRRAAEAGARSAEARADDLESAVELREFARSRLMDALGRHNPELDVPVLDLDELARTVVNFDTAESLLALTKSLTEIEAEDPPEFQSD